MEHWKLIALLCMQGSAQAWSPRHPIDPRHLNLGLIPRAFNTTGTFVVPTSFSTPPIEGSSSSSNTITSASSTPSVSFTTSTSSTLSTSSAPSNSSIPSSSSAPSTSSTPSISSISSLSSTEEFSVTPVTSFPAYTAPTSTISGVSETSSAVAIAPLLVAVWQNRGNLLDSQEKTQYINDVTETKNQIDSLNNNLADKSDPPSECSSTSGDGSLISGIKNLLSTPAKLIGCAAAVVTNLVDTVSEVDPVISTVEVLTDTLMDISNELKKSENEDPTSSRGQTTSTETTSSSACSTTAVASCVETISLSTLFYTESTTTTSQVETITTTLCTTITASCAVGTTATTTVSTATTSSGTGWICDQTCAAGGCQAHKRAQETGAADPDNGVGAPILVNRNLKPISMITDVDKYIIQTISASNSEDLDWSKGIAVAKYYKFSTKGIARYVAGVTGCTSIIITSPKGAWISHFTETGLMDDAGRQMERDSLADAVMNGNSNYQRPSDLAGEGNDLDKNTQDVQIYISAPCATVTDESGKAVCTDDSTFEYPRIDALLETLFGTGTQFEGVPITRRGYLKPGSRDEVDALADTSARGKVVVQYDPNQLTPEFSPYNPKHAAYRVWMESTPYQKDWVASACQGGNAPNQKRDDSCPISGSASASSMATSTTADGSTTSGIPTTSDTATSTNNSTQISSTLVLTSTPTMTPSLSSVNTTMVTMTFTPSSFTQSTQNTSPSTSGITSDSGIGPTFMSTVTFSSFTATLIA
ncbi:hypothetical protein F5Y08DRAFT_353831 [Xylaria arbuscula]|nr:hypothetical protein F5Y08DRAFT_353831 [Xylaria arbuscula]